MPIYQLPEPIENVPACIALALQTDRPELLHMATGLCEQNIPCLVNTLRVLMIYNQRLRGQVEQFQQFSQSIAGSLHDHSRALRGAAAALEDLGREAGKLLQEPQSAEEE